MIRILHFADLHLGVETYGRPDPATGLSTRLLDALRALDELVDYDYDLNLACGDCDDTVDTIYVCACEVCGNGTDDDCDLIDDATDPNCIEDPSCILLTSGADPQISINKGVCDAFVPAGPFDIIRGGLGNLDFYWSSIDLGPVECVEGNRAWDRVTEWSPPPNPACDEKAGKFYLARNTGDPDFGEGSGAEPRDTMDPNPPCP